MLTICGMQLLRSKDLSLSTVRFFVIDECDKVLDKTGAPCVQLQKLLDLLRDSLEVTLAPCVQLQ